MLDLGCGCGAQGIAALQSGAQIPVTFNDIDPDALEAVGFNVQANNIRFFTFCHFFEALSKIKIGSILQ